MTGSVIDIIFLIITFALLVTVGILNAIGAQTLSKIKGTDTNANYAYTLMVTAAVLSIVASAIILTITIVYFVRKGRVNYGFSFAMTLLALLIIFIISIVSAVAAAFAKNNSITDPKIKSVFEDALWATLVSVLGFLIIVVILIFTNRQEELNKIKTEIIQKKGELYQQLRPLFDAPNQ